MAGFFQTQLNSAAGAFFGSDYLRDQQHASKVFRPNAYAYAPKFKFLFHVYFDINREAYPLNVETGSNFGLAVKTVKLPSFNFSTTELNQYNRKRLVQTKIKYDPIDITFHDDNGNVIRNMWQAYYTYYYADSTKPKVVFAGARGGQPQAGATSADYNTRNQYSPSISGDDNWGYIGETSTPSGPNSAKLPFFKNITIFGFNQHNFVAYTLINPILSRAAHDTYSYSEGGGTMEMSMGIEYETVVYNQGALDGQTPSNIVTGFGLDSSYDRILSPISRPGSNGTILGPNGLVDGVGGAINDLANGNILGAIQKAGTTYNTFKNGNLSKIVKAEVTQGISNVLVSGAASAGRALTVNTPIYGSSPTYAGTAGTPNAGVSAPSNIGNNPYAGKQLTSGPKQ
jgi:hypothetical protein